MIKGLTNLPSRLAYRTLLGFKNIHGDEIWESKVYCGTIDSYEDYLKHGPARLKGWPEFTVGLVFGISWVLLVLLGIIAPIGALIYFFGPSSLLVLGGLAIYKFLNTNYFRKFLEGFKSNID